MTLFRLGRDRNNTFLHKRRNETGRHEMCGKVLSFYCLRRLGAGNAGHRLFRKLAAAHMIEAERPRHQTGIRLFRSFALEFERLFECTQTVAIN